MALIDVATEGQQAFSANLQMPAAELFPSLAVGSMAGIGGTAGTIGGVLIAKFVGFPLDLWRS